MRFPESAIHALRECEEAKDVWASSLKILQKGVSGLADFTHLIEYLLDRIELHDMEEFLVQAWQIWNQRNRVVYGGKFHDPGWLITRARELLEDFRTAQYQMRTESAKASSGYLAASSIADLQA